MTSMATGPTWRRLAAAPHAPAPLAGALLALAAFGQALVQGLTHDVGSGGSAPYAIALCLLALASTVPLVFLRPVAAAVAITAGSVLVVAAFGPPTAAGLIAQVIASYRLGATAAFGRAPDDGRAGGADWYTAAALAVPVLVLAVAFDGGAAAVLLAATVPVAVGAAIALRAKGDAARQGEARGSWPRR